MPDLANAFDNLVDLYGAHEEKERLTRLLEDAKTEENARMRNIMNSERWYKKRHGIRPQFVTWPWRNASNLHLPLADKTIRRSKPSFANMVGTQYPTVVLESNLMGDDQTLIRSIERKFHEMLFDEDKMNIFTDICWGIDLMLERGRFITKVVQEFTPRWVQVEIVIANLTPEMRTFLQNPATTDEMLALELIMRYSLDINDTRQQGEIRKAVKQFRTGQPKLVFDRKVNLTPHPTLVVRDPNTILFPQNTTWRISSALWIRDRFVLSAGDIEERRDSGIWEKGNATKLLDDIARDERTGGGRYTQNVPDVTVAGPERYELAREGISAASAGSAYVFDEFYFWKKLPGKKMAERCVLTIQPEHSEYPLRLIRYPYIQPNGEPEDWPFDQVQFEIVGDRAYSPRGYPQILDSLQTELTNNHNAKQNSMTIANNMTFKAKRNSGVSTNFVPGQPVWVNRMDDLQEVNLGQRDLSYDNEERILKGWAEEYIGLLDQTLTNMTGQPERRTKAEIDAVSALQAQVASLDVRVFQACMQKVYRRIWNRWMQYGEDNIELQAPNGDVRSISKQDMKNRLKLRTVGDIFSTNRQLKATRMQGIFQLLRGDPRIDQDALYSSWLTLEDERLAEQILIPQGQVQQEMMDRLVDDIARLNMGYNVAPRPNDDNALAIRIIEDFLRDPQKRRTLHADRMPALQNFHAAHQFAMEAKKKATTRGGRIDAEAHAIAQGERGREAREG